MIKNYVDIDTKLDKVNDECGVFGIYRNDDDIDVVAAANDALYSLQHRGQQSAGITVNKDGEFTTVKELGMVSEIFTPKALEKLPNGKIAVGHVRYTSSESLDRASNQPLVMRYIQGSIGIANNGSITNFNEIRQELETGGAVFQSNSNAEIMAYVIATERCVTDTLEDAVLSSMRKLKGAYSTVICAPSRLIGFRDMHGFRPLCIGKLKNSWIFTSESCVIDSLGGEFVRDVEPGEMVVVDEEGFHSYKLKLLPDNQITVIMMMGLQGAGKTTTTAKIAGKLKAKGKRPLLVACDVYRPAAIEQLKINGEKQQVPVFSMGDKQKPLNIAKAAIEHAKKNNNNVVILDTAGRLHVDEDMMNELVEIRDNIELTQTVLVVDAMTGQDAVNVAKEFNEKIGIDGIIVTKLDGDTRGGAALSIKAITGKPILYIGMGEKLSDLEQFHPDRMASRILGMGDVLSLIEKAEQSIDQDKAKEMEQRLKKAQFTFDDYLEYMSQIKNMGGLSSLLSMMPGVGGKINDDMLPDEKQLGKIEAIIDGGASEVGVESTVITLAGEVPCLLRPGGITLEQLRDTIGEVELNKAVLDKLDPNQKAASPGMKYKHYSPKARVILLKGTDEEYINYVNSKDDGKTAALCCDEDISQLKVKTFSLGKRQDYAQQAHRLFDMLREVDEVGGIDTAYSRLPSCDGVGMALYNRLIRAAGYEVIDLEKI